MNVGKDYWAKELPYPYSPSDDDFKIFKNHLKKGKTLLLGCTHKLIPITDYQMDIDPWYNSSTVIIQDWVTNNIFYDNIIGDGVLNFTKKLTDDVLKMCSKNCNFFMARVFNKKLPNMKIANYFPFTNDFEIKPNNIISFENYNFFSWNFYEN